MSITFTNGANSVTISNPQYGYKSRVAMGIEWADCIPPAAWDNGATSDIRTCLNLKSWLNATDALALATFVATVGYGRSETVTMSLGATASGFFPFGPDKGDVGDFTVRFVPESAIGGISGNPFLYFETDISMVLVTAPAYTIPAARVEGPLAIGTVAGLRWPGFQPAVARAVGQVVTYGGTPYDIDNGKTNDEYRSSCTQRLNSPNAAALVAFLSGASGRGGDITITSAANFYIFGIEKPSGGQVVAMQTLAELEITHDGFDDFSIPLEFYYKSTVAPVGGQFTITIDKSKVSGTNTNIPILFSQNCSSIPAAFWSGVTDANGLDIRFYETDGTTELEREIVSFGSGGTIEAWVKIPSATSSVNKSILCKYGSSARANDSTVCDAKIQLHLDNLTDSSGNGYNATNTGAESEPAGKIGKGYNFIFSGPRDDNMVIAGSSAIDYSAGATVSMWIKYSSFRDDGYNTLFTAYDGGGLTAGFASLLWRTSLNHFYNSDGATLIYANDLGTSFLVDTWYYRTFVFDPVAGLSKIYHNGIETSSVGTAIGMDISSAHDFSLSKRYESTLGTNGVYDEVRVYNYPLGPDRILTEYNNQNDPASFATCST